jgi:hypothetical protein
MGHSAHETFPGEQPIVNELVIAYIEWREESAEVWDAYRSWAIAPDDDAVCAYAAYQAALDREEAAANAYAELMERVGRLVLAGVGYLLEPEVRSRLTQ